MSMNVLEFPRAGAKPVPAAPVYFIQWSTEAGRHECKSTSDRASVKRQLESCRKRGLPALVKYEDGGVAGGVICMTSLKGSLSFRATLDDESWGDF